jgi:orotidine-5'-phosphate decarboxylase
MSELSGNDRIIVALDVPTLDQAGDLVKELAPHVGMFKIGLYLLSTVGLPQIVAWFKEQGIDLKQLFIDGKIHDIPFTMGNAALATSEFGVGVLNVHASAGIDGMMAAVKNSKSGEDTGGPEQYRDTLVWAVTVLTSLGEEQTHITFGDPVKAQVLQFARDAKLAGVDGLICSAQEAEIIKGRPELVGLTVATPAIRPAWSVAGDQKRIVTPKDAVVAGADYLIIGRPLRDPPPAIGGPLDAVKKVVEEIEEGEKEKAKKE